MNLVINKMNFSFVFVTIYFCLNVGLPRCLCVSLCLCVCVCVSLLSLFLSLSIVFVFVYVFVAKDFCCLLFFFGTVGLPCCSSYIHYLELSYKRNSFLAKISLKLTFRKESEYELRNVLGVNPA